MTPDPDQLRAEIESTQEQLGDTVEALARKTDVKAQASARAEAAKASIEETVHDAQRSAQRARDDATQRLRNVTPESARESLGRVSASVQARPLPVATVTAFLVGVLVGRILTRR